MPTLGAPCDLHVSQYTFPSPNAAPDSTLTLYIKTGGPHNHLISKIHYGREWDGNIVIIQHCTATKKLTSLHMGQINFVDQVLKKYVYHLIFSDDVAHNYQGFLLCYIQRRSLNNQSCPCLQTSSTLSKARISQISLPSTTNSQFSLSHPLLLMPTW